ncbi:MAG: large subunit ribosomal protein [Thermoleophilaceae bacterium]|jgi:large subunit ribosomal protein L25|nr:large subunit ribosomal protein [Thermoleophilaceae bacterium]
MNVEPRPVEGSRATRRLRREGFVPGIVYGGGEDPRTFRANAHDLERLMHSGAAVFDLKFDGDAIPVIVKDQQLHPVRSHIMHIDMLRVNLNETIQTTVIVEVHGAEEAPGVKEGGVLEQVTRELHIEALPGDIPEKVDVDVSDLEAAGTRTLADVTPPEGVKFLDVPEETVIATITIPAEEPEEPEIEEETELVAEGEAAAGDEEAAAAEGATGDEAESSGGEGSEGS